MVILAIVRARRRRLRLRNQPDLPVIAPGEPTFIGPLPPKPTESREMANHNGAGTEVASQIPDTTSAPDIRAESDLSPVVHIVPPDVAEYVIPDFRPHLDTCKVDLSYPDIDFVHWRAPGMAAMLFTEGDETLAVFFQGLDVVPFDAVFIRFDHPRKGQQCCLLSELLDVLESEITQDQPALPLDAERDVPGGHQSDDNGPRQFHNFDTARECIEVFVPEDRIATTTASISSTSEGSDAFVVVDGRVVAVLIGASDAGPHNIKLVAVDQTAAA